MDSASIPPPMPPDGTPQTPVPQDVPVVPSAPSEFADRLKAEIAELESRNDALTDAVVNSAEVIEELEQTRRQLAEAQQAAEVAHLNFKLMAESIFEGTRDAMLVLDKRFRLLSANRNGRIMFDLTECQDGSDVRRHLQSQFHLDRQSNWFDELLRIKNDDEQRFELYQIESRDQQKLNDSLPTRNWIEFSISSLEKGASNARYLITAHDITERKQMEEQFQHQALHDNVTQLPNRRFFVKQVEFLLARSNSDFSICFLDLDNFKTVNDTLGHEAGDQLLLMVADRIRSTIRQDSFLARFGGDEFALLLANLSAMEVEAVGNRIINQLKRPFVIGNNSVYVGISIGMTRYPEDAKDVNGLLQNADVAMYSAKENGRNCFHPFTPELAAGVYERQTLLEELRESVERRQIALEYQPKWCLATDQVVGCEALLRWQRNGKMVSPTLLVEVAECSGLITPLGQLVLENAIRQMACWQNQLQLDGMMSINVSTRELIDPQFTSRLQTILDIIGISPSSIELEITETAMMENMNLAFEQFRRLRELGVSIAIDDFGTGYSSLSYLKSLPVSTLKIDRSFVSDLPHDKKAVAIAKAIVALGHGLGLKVVAEGVETQQQRDFLTEIQCDTIQGFLLSHSLKPADFANWVNQRR